MSCNLDVRNCWHLGARCCRDIRPHSALAMELALKYISIAKAEWGRMSLQHLAPKCQQFLTSKLQDIFEAETLVLPFCPFGWGGM